MGMRLTEVPEDVEVLNSLGLSLNEVKVFLALSQLGTSTAKTIAKCSGVAREVVYQVMSKLLEKGLVEAVIAAPKKFKAIPMKEAYAMLLRRKEEENRELCKKAREALQKHQNKTALKVEGNHQIILVHAGEGKQFRISQEYTNVQKSVDLTFPAGKFLQWSQYYAEWGINEVMKKNVEMRIITEQQLLKILATNSEIFSPSLTSKLRYVNFRYVQNPLSVELMIFDRKTLFVSTTKESDINKMVWLRTNNPLILEMANSYFEAMWEKATEGWT